MMNERNTQNRKERFYKALARVSGELVVSSSEHWYKLRLRIDISYKLFLSAY